MPMSPPLHVLIRSKHSLALGRRAGSGSMQSSINWQRSCNMSQQQGENQCRDCDLHRGAAGSDRGNIVKKRVLHWLSRRGDRAQ